MSIEVKGNFDKTKAFFDNYLTERANYIWLLKKYGEEGVRALSAATPKDTGETSSSWYYEIEQKKDRYIIYWKNSHMAGKSNIPLALLIQYGHGTRNGGYVEGIDYINPALKGVFEDIANNLWRDLIK